MPEHGQTLANRTKPGASFQLYNVLHVYAMQLWYYETILPNLKLKTRPKQLLGSLPLDIALHDQSYEFGHTLLGYFCPI